MSGLPWERSIPVSAESVQLEAREQSIKFALAAIDEALAHLKIARCCEQAAVHIDRAELAIREAIEQLEGRATP